MTYFGFSVSLSCNLEHHEDCRIGDCECCCHGFEPEWEPD